MNKKLLFGVLLSGGILMTSCGGNSKQNSSDSEDVEVSAVDAEEAEEENTFMIPGETYYVDTKTRDGWGDPITARMEFVIYKDGSMSGKIYKIDENGNKDESSIYNGTLEGNWQEISKNDKEFLEIEYSARVMNEETGMTTSYVDKDLNIYPNSVNDEPKKLMKK